MAVLRLCTCIGMVMLACVSLAEAVRTDFADASNVNRHQAESDLRGYEVRGTTPIAFAVAPKLETPADDCSVTGFRFSLFAGDHVDVYGLDIGLLGNFTKREIGGLQISGLFNVVGESDGAFQLSAVFNDCKGTFKGVQVGLFNNAEKVSGVQVGVVNHTNVMYGLQIGVLNFIEASAVPFFPIVNFAF